MWKYRSYYKVDRIKPFYTLKKIIPCKEIHRHQSSTCAKHQYDHKDLIVIKNIDENCIQILNSHLNVPYMKVVYKAETTNEYPNSGLSNYNLFMAYTDISPSIALLKKLFPPHNRYGICFEILSPHISKYFQRDFKITTFSNIDNLLLRNPTIFYQKTKNLDGQNSYFFRLKYARDFVDLIENITRNCQRTNSNINDENLTKCFNFMTLHNPNNFYSTTKMILRNLDNDLMSSVNNVKNSVVHDLEYLLQSKVLLQNNRVIIEPNDKIHQFTQLMDWHYRGFFCDPYFDINCSTQMTLCDQIWLPYDKPEEIVNVFDRTFPQIKHSTCKHFKNYHNEAYNYAILRIQDDNLIHISSKLYEKSTNAITLPRRTSIFSNVIILDDKYYGTEIDDVTNFIKPHKFHSLFFEMVNGEPIIKIIAKDIPSYYGILHTKCVDRKDFLSATPARFTPFYKHINNPLFKDYYYWVDYKSIVFYVNAFSIENAKDTIKFVIEHMLQTTKSLVTNDSIPYKIKYIKEGEFQLYMVVLEFNNVVLSPESAFFLNGYFNQITSIQPVSFWNDPAKKGIPYENEFLISGLPDDIDLSSYLKKLFNDIEYNSLQLCDNNKYLITVSKPSEIDKLLAKNFDIYDEYFNVIINQNVYQPSSVNNELSCNTFFIKNDDTHIEMTNEQLSEWLHPLIPNQITKCAMNNDYKVTFNDTTFGHKLMYKSGTIHQDFDKPLFVRFCPQEHENDYNSTISLNDIHVLNDTLKPSSISLHELFKISFPPKNCYTLGVLQPSLKLAKYNKERTMNNQVNEQPLVGNSLHNKFDEKIFHTLDSNDTSNHDLYNDQKSAKFCYNVWNKRNITLKEADEISHKIMIQTTKKSFKDLIDISKSRSSLRTLHRGYIKTIETVSPAIKSIPNIKHKPKRIDAQESRNIESSTDEFRREDHTKSIIKLTKTSNSHHIVEPSKINHPWRPPNYNLILPIIMSRIEQSNQTLPEQFRFTQLGVTPKFHNATTLNSRQNSESKPKNKRFRFYHNSYVNLPAKRKY